MAPFKYEERKSYKTLTFNDTSECKKDSKITFNLIYVLYNEREIVLGIKCVIYLSNNYFKIGLKVYRHFQASESGSYVSSA